LILNKMYYYYITEKLTFRHTNSYKIKTTSIDTNQIMMWCCYNWGNVLWIDSFSVLIKKVVTNWSGNNTFPVFFYKNITRKENNTILISKYKCLVYKQSGIESTYQAEFIINKLWIMIEKNIQYNYHKL